MSKMDGLRAMREARYAAREAKPTAARMGATQSVPEPAEAQPPEALLCGHRAISGRTCIREHGHDSKSHRYS